MLRAVFLVSLSSLAFEVLLTRVFSISQWNHLSFMVISIALFGFAASGTLLSLMGAWKKGWEKTLSEEGPVSLIVLLYAFSAVISFVALQRIPLDYFRLPVAPLQMFWLLSAYLLLSLPFLFAGMIVSLAYAARPGQAGAIYASGMAGSAAGALLPAVLLPWLPEGELVVLAALVALPAVRIPEGDGQWTCRLARAGSVAALGGGALLVLFFPGTLSISPSPYKGLSQLLKLPDTKVTRSAGGLKGRIDWVESPHIRHAPGLSLKFSGALPPQSALFLDGDLPLALYDFSDSASFGFARFTLPHAGYRLHPKPSKVLVIASGGGAAIPSALASESSEITVVTGISHVAKALRAHYGLSVICETPRALLARSEEKFSVIHLDNRGTSLPGSAALGQEHLFTIQGISACLSRLEEDGVLIVSRRLLLPPSDSIRLFATAFTALKALGAENPALHLAVLRNWGDYVLIASVRPLSEPERLVAFCRRMNFDVVHLPAMAAGSANRFNIFAEAHHHLVIRRLVARYGQGREESFFRDYLLDVRPLGDGRPFPGRFLKWGKLPELYRSMGERPYALLLSGEVVVAVVFFEALGIALVLLAAPRFAAPKASARSPANILFFLFLGAGFMFVELFFIKAYGLLFGDPVISFTVVLAGILVFSGVGGWFSARMGERGLAVALALLAGLLLLFLLFREPLLSHLLKLPVHLRYLFSLLLLIPPGVVMGIPFPLGMERLLSTPVQRAYAWAANGCASVLTAIAAARIALSPGIDAILVCGILSYLLAIFSLGRGRRGCAASGGKPTATSSRR